MKNSGLMTFWLGALELYKQNHVQYDSDAWVCKIIRTVVRSFTWFFNNEHERHITKIPLAVSGEQCHEMARWKRCSVGPLTIKGNLWRTSIQPDWTFSGGGTRCCYWKEVFVDNCFLYKAKVYKRHVSKQMESTAGVTSHCSYSSGNCPLEDKSFLVWTPNKTEQCQFLPWKLLNGKRFGANWLATDGNLALTHNSNRWTKDCVGKRIRMSEQGLPFYFLTGGHSPAAIKLAMDSPRPYLNRRFRMRAKFPHSKKFSTKASRKVARFKRANSKYTYDTDGPVPSEVLASSLQALEFDIQNNLEFSVGKAISNTCHQLCC